MITRATRRISIKLTKFLCLTGAFFTVLLCAPLVHAQDLVGVWSGTVYQTGPGSESSAYPANMVLNGVSGSMDYPTLDCGGQLTFLNKRDTIYYYSESITYGRDKCINGGMIAVEPNGNSLQWAWNVSGVTVSGVLNGSRRLPPCAECSAARERCFTGCNSEPTLQDQNRCVNQCNKEYSCVMGYDCN